MITASAPGKAVLSGEYVVLRDAPAIATAVDHRVRVRITECSGDYHSISTPGYLEGSWRFRRDARGEFEWQDRLPEPSAFSLVEEVWTSFDTVRWPSLALEIDSKEFCDVTTGAKLGLGSSAAVAVALSTALQKYRSANDDAGEIAMDAHNRFQGGRGSGVDVATSLHGGVILYRRATTEVRQTGWPAGLHYRFLWSGRAAATSEKLAKLDDRPGNGPKSDSINALNEHAENVAAAWSGGDSGLILQAFPAYIEALRLFSVDHDLGIFDAGHGELAQLASDDGIVYKPCGAGGGDIGVVLAATEQAISRFCEGARQQDFSILDTSLESDGVLFAG